MYSCLTRLRRMGISSFYNAKCKYQLIQRKEYITNGKLVDPVRLCLDLNFCKLQR